MKLKDKFRNMLRFEKQPTLVNETKMTFRERMEFYSSRLTTMESDIKDNRKAISKLYEEFGILRQRIDDCQMAEKERNDTHRDSKGDWKWIVGIVLSLIALVVGWLL